MKKLIPVILIIAISLLAGCTSRNDSSGNTGGIKDSTITAGKTGDGAGTNDSALQIVEGSNSSVQAAGAPKDLKPVKPGTIPQLSDAQKSEVNTKINSVLNDMDNALKSLQDPQDIDLTSIN
jgi:hypothetical protein